MDFQRARDLVVVLAIEASGLGEVQNERNLDPVAIIDIDEAHAFKPALSCLLRFCFQAFGRGRSRNERAKHRPKRGPPGTHTNVLVFGKPLGASRPASARLPRQSRSSALGSFCVRPAGSSQVRPSSSLNTLASESPPSL